MALPMKDINVTRRHDDPLDDSLGIWCLVSLSTENESIAAKFGKARRKSVVFAQQKENQQQMIQVHMEMRALNSIRNGAFSVLYLFLLFILVLCVL
ncbi:hypothetical protein L2E82_13781 [Cichorium intybus]|uniref:Uncharacterized protein n=1 Tax=Cichorium intybus TaxID=13427 RepID=A0ACB9EXU5_CICIN|nr:hypothetical protein L2E82_13781 [Cichorium intybus]